jgi:hypothetical protein
MRRLFFVCLIVFQSMLAVSGEVVHTYHFGQPEISRNGVYDVINFSNTMLTNRAGEPLLPYHALSLLLPPGERAVSIEIVREGEILLDGAFQIMPAQPSRPLSESKPFVFMKNEAVYASSEAYPSSPSGTLTTQYLNGHSFAFSSFTPMEYVPSTGQLKYYSKVTVYIETETDPASKHSMLRSDEKIQSRVKRLAQNSDMLFRYNGKTKSAGDYELLIITPMTFAAGFNGLIEMYKARGIRSSIQTTEYILANMSGIDLQEKMRNYIIQEYQNHGIETVLLGGDVELIPHRGFYCYVQSGSGYTDNGIPADLYYSGLDGTWNDNGNNRWGEPGEDDLLPEVAVGRMPFNTATELANMIHKSISYQNQPVLGEFTKSLLVGEHLYSAPETWGSDYLELLIGQRSDNGYTTIGIPESYTFQRLYEEDFNWSKNDLMNAINQGKQFVHHVGHASQTYVAKFSNSDITNANFSQVNGIIRNYSLLQTHGCDCGAFDYSDCILEKMVTIQNFAVAVVGNSRYGWFNEGQTEGPAAHLHREMTDAMFHERISMLGQAMVEGKTMTAPWVTAPGQWEEGALRWNFYDLNILGDPAVSVWTNEPMLAQVGFQSEIMLGIPTMEVSVTAGGFAAEGFRLSIVKDDDIIAVGMTNESGIATLEFNPPVTDPGAASLQVSGYNILPQNYELMFIPGEGPYVIYENHVLDDSGNENSNGLADYSETIVLNMQIKNVGMAVASNVNLTLTSSDSFVTITDGSSAIPELPAGAVGSISAAFAFEISDDVPDQHMVVFALQSTDGSQTWNSAFSIPVNAPFLEVGNLTINDAVGGNGNGMLDPGEIVQFVIEAKNTGHSPSMDALAELLNYSSWITVSTAGQQIGQLLPDQTMDVVFEVVVNPNTPYGTVAELLFTLDAISHSANKPLFLPVGMRIEDFETGDFSAYEWHHAGNSNWTITNQQAFEGNFCAKSGAIGNNQQSDLWLSLIVMSNDEIKFARKVSSESNYDYLSFYIDNNLAAEWSGEQAWLEVSFPLTDGPHNLRWSYSKDGSVASGSDCAWVDKITFPGTTTVIDLGENRLLQDITVAPNPNNGKFYIIAPENTQLNFRLFNAVGKLVFENSGQTTMIQVDAGFLTSGVYILEVSDSNQSFRKKIIIEK